MRRNKYEDEAVDGAGTVFRDVMLLALAGFVAIVLLIVPHINPDGEIQSQVSSCPQGDMIVEMVWDYNKDIDVDLWVQAPGDVPVGYSNKGGVVFNLLRDDLGMRGDFTGVNMEMSVARFAPDGTYTVNTHLYRNPARHWPVTVQTSVHLCQGDRIRRVLESVDLIEREGVELTIFNFDIQDLELVPGSVNNIQRRLRGLARSGGGM